MNPNPTQPQAQKENLYTPRKIRTSSGIYLNPLQLLPTEVFIGDIATGLARKCRFGGYTKNWWSVADHSVECALEAERRYPDKIGLPLAMMLHDAHEAYLVDLPTPTVDAINEYAVLATDCWEDWRDAKPLDDNWWKKMWLDAKEVVQSPISQRFGAENIMHIYEAQIKEIDKAMLEWEWKNKVLSWKGMPAMIPDASIETYLYHFRNYCKTPYTVWP